MPKTMKAVTYHKFGSFENLQVELMDVPEAGEGEVLVRVEAAGVNPVDAAVLKGHLKGAVPHNFPIIPGWDFSGTIEERGFSSRRFDVGEGVYGYARRPVVQWGTFAEYITIPESYLSRRPVNLSPAGSGGIPLVGLTAYQSLYEAGQLEEGQTVLILGASGGVGSMGIQLALARGARVAGVASKANHDYMEELGSESTIDYHDTDVGKAVRDRYPEGVDLIFDCTSGTTLEQSLPALKPDGKLVSILNRGDELDPDIDFEYVFVEPNSRQLDHLRELAEADKLEVHISHKYNMDEAAEALRQIEKLHTRGKIVVKP